MIVAIMILDAVALIFGIRIDETVVALSILVFLKFDLKFDLWQTLVVAGKQIFVVLDFAERCPLAVIRPVSIYIYMLLFRYVLSRRRP